MEDQTIQFNKDGLICAVAQDIHTKEVLMQAWMNEESLAKTQETGLVHYYSRSRQCLWCKGETSGHFQHVRDIRCDCDGDCLLVLVEQDGGACHTGAYSCFYRALGEPRKAPQPGAEVLSGVYRVICDRREHPKEGSYTNYLFDKGVDKMCKKIGEEAAEVIIAAKNTSKEELQYEASDLLYHLMVIMVQTGVTWDDLFAELAKRR